MRQYLGCQTYGNTFGPLCQQKGELDRQIDGLLIFPVVRIHPFGSLGIEHHFFGELRQPAFNIPSGSIGIAGDDIAPVALAVHKQIFLAYLDQGSEYGRISMRMQFHGLADDGGHFRISAVIDLEHRMQDTSLDRFQSIVNMRHGPLEYDIRRVVEKPLLEHPGKPVLPAAVVQQLVVFTG